MSPPHIRVFGAAARAFPALRVVLSGGAPIAPVATHIEPEPIGHGATSASTEHFVGILRGTGAPNAAGSTVDTGLADGTAYQPRFFLDALTSTAPACEVVKP